MTYDPLFLSPIKLNKMEVFETNRLLVRELELGDLTSLLELFNDEVVKQFYPGYNNIERIKLWVKQSQMLYKKFGHGMWAVILKKTHKLIGQVGIVFQNIDGKDEYEISELFLSGYTGYSREAVRYCILIAFDYIKVDRLVGLVETCNQRAIKFADSFYFSQIGRTDKWGKEFYIYAKNNPNK